MNSRLGRELPSVVQSPEFLIVPGADREFKMRKSIEIQPTGPLHATVQPPGSKSLTNRALVCAALATGPSVLRGALDSEDTRVMIEALRNLGIATQSRESGTVLEIPGCDGRIPAGSASLSVGNSGTTIRFLTAMLATAAGEYRLDGVPRMRERPIGDLLAALAQLGADVTSEAGNGCPPVVVRAQGLRGGETRIRGDISSQFLSGLLMAAPYARQPVTIIVDGQLVSQPYVTMTLGVMAAFGVAVDSTRLDRFTIPVSHFRGREYLIEPDASAASYFWAAAAIRGGSVTVQGLTRHSLQGDVAFCECLERMGCRIRYETNGITVIGPEAGATLRGIDTNMNGISDTVQTLAAVALFAAGPTTVRGVAHIRHKETDRIGDLARELRKLGAAVDELDDGLRITPRPVHGATIQTYRDHRMAMSLSLVGLRVPGVVILDPDCTAKTYPSFFSDLARLVASS